MNFAHHSWGEVGAETCSEQAGLPPCLCPRLGSKGGRGSPARLGQDCSVPRPEPTLRGHARTQVSLHGAEALTSSSRAAGPAKESDMHRVGAGSARDTCAFVHVYTPAGTQSQQPSTGACAPAQPRTQMCPFPLTHTRPPFPLCLRQLPRLTLWSSSSLLMWSAMKRTPSTASSTPQQHLWLGAGACPCRSR